ncbi:dermonecrotic toxin domain-containing protein [Acerihabitans arboris]|uniref:Dermonecrotic toxin N-terminal domain-containing protein n=1 Tax=Acerihabitans arboris TaxID=2691583 RepID=A0A845SKJ7_9GAMM|nr:DUF6543 domain-containing protein [Acerihabitans arboris]NDL63484.1 hypothetical protein [Acerihabitans arboris]
MINTRDNPPVQAQHRRNAGKKQPVNMRWLPREPPSLSHPHQDTQPLIASKRSVLDEVIKSDSNSTENSIITNERNITASLTLLHQSYAKMYPELYSVAADEMKKALKKRTGLIVDPNKIFFHHFTEAQNDRYAVTGWRHDYSTPVESRTVTECMLSNFPADARDNLDVLDQMAGIYRDAATTISSFGAENQVPIKPSVVLSIVSDTDFFKVYTKKLTRYWTTDIPEMINISSLLSGLAQIKNKDHGIVDFYLKAFSIIPDANKEVKKYLFDINGFLATDLTVLTHASTSEVALYLPRGKQKIYRFPSLAKMKHWFAANCKSQDKRKLLAAHFSLYNRQEGAFYQGVDRWLELIGHEADNADYLDKIWTNRDEITGELIGVLTSGQMKRAYSDADSLIKSNTEVSRDMLMRYLSIANMLLPNPVTPLISIGMDIDKWVNGDNETERQQGAQALYGDGVNIVLMALSGVLEGRLAIPYDEMSFVPEHGAYRESITTEVRSGIQKIRKNYLKIQNERNIPETGNLAAHARGHSPGKQIIFGHRILQKIGDAGIKASRVDQAHLSKADDFGIMRGQDGKNYILINKKIYKVKSIGKKGFYYLDEEERIGIFLNPKSKKYINVDFSDPGHSELGSEGNNIPLLPRSDKIFLALSPRLRNMLRKITSQGIPADKIEKKIVFDKLNKIFIDPKTNKKLLKVSNNYYPLQEKTDGYIIFGMDEQQNEKKLMRVYFSAKNPGGMLITRGEWAKEIFTSSRLAHPLIKLRPLGILDPGETTLLQELQSVKYQSYYDSPLREIPDEFLPDAESDLLAKQSNRLQSTLVKLKPERCVVKKNALLNEKEMSNIKKHTLFVMEKCALAELENSGNINNLPEPGYRLVNFEIHLVKKGYPINVSSENGAGGKIAIVEKSHFTVKEIIGDRIVLQEADERQLKALSGRREALRKLYPGNVVTAHSRLRHETAAMAKLLEQGMTAPQLEEDVRARYGDMLIGMAHKAVYSPVIEEFTEAGSDFINNWLRFGDDDIDVVSARASEEAQKMLAEYALLNDWGPFAYRSAIYPTGVYGGLIKEGDVIIDRGFMSASAIPINSIEWLNNWTRNIARIKGDRVIMIFDKSVPKKIASNDFLTDHVLVKPGTPLKVLSIYAARDAKGDGVFVVGVSRGTGAEGVKDIFTGGPTARRRGRL